MNFLHVSYEDICCAKGSLKYFHNKKEINSNAFNINDSAEIRVILPSFVGSCAIVLEIFKDDYSPFNVIEMSYQGHFNYSYDVFSAKLTDIGVGIWYFRLNIKSPLFNLYGYQNDCGVYISKEEYGNLFQFSIINPSENSTETYEGGIIYHVFVDRFFKYGKVSCRDDAILRDDWDDGIPDYPEYPGAFLKNNTFFGGTLYGIIKKLDYLKSLGVSMIYLSPIFEAYSNHKYDTGDYMKVDSMFGGEAALKKLIAEAKKRNIGIILDGVFNHTGADSVYFNKFGRYKSTGAYQSMDSEYFDWYEFQNYPDKYTCWWDIEILPRINPDKTACGDFIAGKNGVIEKYMKLGVSGFRLDVADELSDDFLKRIKSKLRELNSESILYGEVWEDASNKIAYGKRKKYFLGNELDGVMNYPLRSGIISYLRDKDISPLKYALCDVMVNSPIHVRNVMMNLLGTHDTERIITALAGKPRQGKTNAELARTKLSPEELVKGAALVKQAYLILATLPGIPTIYYGDEVGLEGYSDPFNRRPFPWKNMNQELLCFYKLIGNIRKENKVYKNGDFVLNYLDNDLLVFTRSLEDDSIITAVNNSSKDIVLTLDKPGLNLINALRAQSFKIMSGESVLIKTKSNNSFYIDKKPGVPT